jgi:cyclophilin family peptidyl-prolyl cis-trans isomerase
MSTRAGYAGTLRPPAMPGSAQPGHLDSVPVSTSKQRRQAAQRHLQRQLERRTVLVRRRRRNAAITAAAVVAVVVVGAVLLLTGVFAGKKNTSAAGATASSAAPTSAAATAARTTSAAGTVSCSFVVDKTGNKSLKDVGTPPNPKATPAKGTSTLKMTTNQGVLTLTLDRAKAPCAASSFAYLASKKFFDNTICHREVNEATFGVLQCGDPTGTGLGGPSYTYGEEVTPATKYPRGTIAMAKSSAPGSTASQFFLCFTDTQLAPDYTVVGTVDKAGLAVLDKIAKVGNNGSFASTAGGGAPKTPVKITSISVTS